MIGDSMENHIEQSADNEWTTLSSTSETRTLFENKKRREQKGKVRTRRAEKNTHNGTVFKFIQIQTATFGAPTCELFIFFFSFRHFSIFSTSSRSSFSPLKSFQLRTAVYLEKYDIYIRDRKGRKEYRRKLTKKYIIHTNNGRQFVFDNSFPYFVLLSALNY